MSLLIDAPAPATVRPAGGPTRRAPHGSTRHGVGFWVVAAVFLTSIAFATVPTPLYPLYQRRDGFSAFAVTVVFAVYAVGVVVALILAGHVSDWAGRKRVALPALGLEMVAALLFLLWPALPGLLLARFLTGLGVGLITATTTAYLFELHTAHRPQDGPNRFEVVSAGANLGGFGAGTLVAGALAQFVTAPLRTPYAVFLILLALGALAMAAVPETVAAPAVRPRYRPQQIRLAAGDPRAHLISAAGAFAGFAVFGLFTSLAPSFVAGTLHHPSRLMAGTAVFLVFGSAATAQMATGGLSPRRRFALGLRAEACGVLVLVAGVTMASLPLFLAGGVVAGAGAGLLFKSAVAQVAAAAEPAQRGEALAGLFLAAYLGLIGPVLGLGLATRVMATTTAMLWFAGLLLTLLAVIAVLASSRKATKR